MTDRFPLWPDDPRPKPALAKPRARRTYPEAALQRSIKANLEARWRDCLVHHSPNEGRRSPKEGAKLRFDGMVPGFPDLIIIWPGGVGFLEVKSAKGLVSANQSAVIALLRAMGHNVAVVRTLDEAVDTVTAWRAV